MSNSKTIDGVSREIALFESIIGKKPDAFLHEPVYQVTESEVMEFASQLSAPAVERQEPRAPFYISVDDWNLLVRGDVEIASVRVSRTRRGKFTESLFAHSLEVAALQSTIAQLQARVQELESGMGEPVCYQARHSENEPWFFTDKPGYWEWRPLFTAPPAPAATLWEICMPDEPGNPESPCEYVYVNSVAGRDLLLLREGSSVYAEYACLDAAAALNGPAK